MSDSNKIWASPTSSDRATREPSPASGLGPDGRVSTDALLALAQRCEVAETGSFDLSKSILLALGYSWRGMDYWYRDNSHTWPGLASLTLSIDAALTLVPEGCDRADHVWPDAEGGFCTYLWASVSGCHSIVGKSRAATPALALCAAALRARTAQGGAS